MLTAPTIGARWPRISTPPRSSEPAIQAISVTRGNDSQGHGAIGGEAAAIADALAHPHALHGDNAAGQRHHRAAERRRAERRRDQAVEQQAGTHEVGPTRESRSSAAELAAWRTRGPAANSSSARHAALETLCAARRTALRQARRRCRNACAPHRARGSELGKAPAACGAGCRGESRDGSCRYRSSGDSRSVAPRVAAPTCSAAPAAGLEIVGVRS